MKSFQSKETQDGDELSLRHDLTVEQTLKCIHLHTMNNSSSYINSLSNNQIDISLVVVFSSERVMTWAYDNMLVSSTPDKLCANNRTILVPGTFLNPYCIFQHYYSSSLCFVLPWHNNMHSGNIVKVSLNKINVYINFCPLFLYLTSSCPFVTHLFHRHPRHN